MGNFQVAKEILAVAREVVADEFPAGMSEKGQKALTALRQSVVTRHIWNTDYNDIKSILSRDFEKAAGNLESDITLSSFLYVAASSGLYQISSINKFARDVRSFIRAKDTSKFFPPAHVNRPQDEREKKIVENWDYYETEAEKYLQRVETWNMVLPLLKEASQYVEKGRKPVEHGPDYVGPYVPPMAGAQAMKLVQSKLTEIVESQRVELVEKMAGQNVKSVEPLAGIEIADIHRFKKEHPELEDFGYDLYTPVKKNLLVHMDDPWTVRPDYKEWLYRKAESAVQDMIERYIYKNTGKIAPIVHAKGEPSSVAVKSGRLSGWGFGGWIRFEFSDGTGFSVHNQAVAKWNYRKMFYQFPTTFHDVKFRDGKTKAMVPEQDMNEAWAKEV